MLHRHHGATYTAFSKRVLSVVSAWPRGTIYDFSDSGRFGARRFDCSGALSSRAIVDRTVLDKVARFIGWTLVVYLCMRFWDMLSVSYTYAPGTQRSNANVDRWPTGVQLLDW